MKLFGTPAPGRMVARRGAGEQPAFAFRDGTNLAPAHDPTKGNAFAKAAPTRISVSKQAAAALSNQGLTLGTDGVIRGPSGAIDLRGHNKPNEDVAVDVGLRGFTIRAREAGERGLGGITNFSAKDLGGLETDVAKSSFTSGSLPGRVPMALALGHTRISGVEMWVAQGTKISAEAEALERLAERGYRVVDDHRVLAPNGDEIDLLGSNKKNLHVELTMAGNEVLLRVRENNFAPWQQLQFALNGGFS